MDSCHLFNFLFGTKKATSELSRCFSSLSENAKKKSQDRKRKISEANDNTNRSASTCNASTSISNNSNSSTSSYKVPEGCNNNINNNSNQVNSTPQSPLKQLQMKIANFASSSRKPERSCSPTCDDRCGTYRATLVRSIDNDEELQSMDEEISLSITEDSLLKEPSHTSHLSIDKQDSHVYDEKMKSKAQNHRQHTAEERSMTLNRSSKAENLQDLNNNNITDCYRSSNSNTDGSKSQHCRAPKYKQFILYSDNHELDQEENQVVSSTAEVYNIVSGTGDAKAKLKKVNSNETDDEKRIVKQEHCNQLEKKDKREEEGEVKPKSHNDNDDDCEILQDKRNVYVRNLVRSIESSGSFESDTTKCTAIQNSLDSSAAGCVAGFTKPVTIVKPLPPKTPPKTNKAKCLNMQLIMNKPTKIQQLFQDEGFLSRFFDTLEPLERCTAAQVCRLWRNLLYANQNYWKDLINVIDCTQLRREHLVECILNTLKTAKLKQHKSLENNRDSSYRPFRTSQRIDQSIEWATCGSYSSKQFDYDINSATEMRKRFSGESYVFDIDQDDVWRIQELCNRFTQRNSSQPALLKQSFEMNNNSCNLQSVPEQQLYTTSKSSSIPSQISSTLSSVSLSSLFSPLSECSRVESIKERLYTSLDNRGFDAICLYGATDDDIDELISKLPLSAHRRILVGKLNNCCNSNRGLESFLNAFNHIQELELSGCNELTNSLEFGQVNELRRLIITDCINIADGLAQKLVHFVHKLDELTIQAYHLTDAFFDYLCLNSDTSRLTRLELPNCKEITNQSMVTIAKHFPNLEALSISGSTKISDDGLDVLAENAHHLKLLDLSWCARITDISLERIACELGDTLTDLILDRNIHITDTGLGYLATMTRLTLLHIRWCPRITDIGLESVIDVKSLRYLSLAGIHQITARSLLCLIETDLLEVELTNCPTVNTDLLMFLTSKMPNCNIVF